MNIVRGQAHVRGRGQGLVGASVVAILLGLAATLPAAGAPCGGFDGGRHYPGLRNLGELVAGDLDNDGDRDLVSSHWLDDLIVVRLNHGNGSYQAPVPYAAGDSPRELGLADFDRDGFLDVATTANNSNAVMLLFGNGDGTLQPATAVPLGLPFGPWGFAIGDLDTDGNQDLVITTGSAKVLQVMLGNGDGTFQTPTFYDTLWVSPAQNLLVDLDQDGALDVVFGDAGSLDGLAAMLGNGDGTFQTVQPFVGQGRISQLAAADLDSDGYPDLVTGNTAANGGVYLFRGNGDGTFQTAIHVPAGAFSSSVVIDDLDGDTLPDLVLTEPDGYNQTFVLLGRGNGTFQSAAGFPGGGWSSLLVDLNADGALDLAAGDDPGVMIVLGNGDGTFRHTPFHPSGGIGDAIASGDFDGSGSDDLVVGTRSGGVAILTSRGDGTFQAPMTIQLASALVWDVDVVDLDGDGALDVLAGCDPAQVAVLLGNGDGTFQPARYYSTVDVPLAMALGDFDQDGRWDLAALTTGGTSVMLGNGDGTFQLATQFPALSGGTDLAVGDVTGDGLLDLLTATGQARVFAGDGAGGFSSLATIGLPDQGLGVAIGDLDLDLSGDLIVGTETGVVVILGNGNGTFQLPVLHGGFKAEYVRAVDLEQDGILDVVSVSDAGAVTLFSGDGTGDLIIPDFSWAAGATVTDLTLADFDARGTLDVAVVDSALPVVSVLLAAPPRIETTLPDGEVGMAYQQQLQASNVTLPLTWAVVAGALPPGLTLASSGSIAGVPSVVGSYPFRVRVTDAEGCTGERDYVLQISDPGCPVIDVQPSTVPDATLGRPFSESFIGTGGSPPYTFGLAGGGLAPGLTLSGLGSLNGVPTAVGTFPFTMEVTDVNGCIGQHTYLHRVVPDGNVLVGQGLGPRNPNRVRVFTEDGAPTPTDFLAYGAGAWGVNVSSADLFADLQVEILTGPGPGPGLGPQVRGFERDGSPLSRVSFYAYGTLRFGVNVASADNDGDGFSELLSGAGPGEVFGPHVRAWNYDGTAIVPIGGFNYYAYLTLKHGVNVAAGDLDRDGFQEILTGPGPGVVFRGHVRGWNYDGAVLTSMAGISFNAHPDQYGVNVAGGDVDRDGFAEIAAAPGPGPANPAHFRGFDFDANQVTLLPGFDVVPTPAVFGGRVGLGDLTTDGAADLLAGQGRDPAADATVYPYSYDGATLQPRLPFVPFGGFYGVNLDGGTHGF